MKKILAGLVGVTLVGATALATTTSAEARWGGWGGWGWGSEPSLPAQLSVALSPLHIMECLRAGLCLGS